MNRPPPQVVVAIPKGLFLATATAAWPLGQRAVMALVLAETCGPARAERVRLNPADVRRLVGLSAHQVRNALACLVTANVLVPLADRDTYALNADHDSWATRAPRANGDGEPSD